MTKNTAEKKYCAKCDKFYKRDQFYKNKAAVDGLTSYCKECNKKVNRQHKLANQIHYTQYDKVRHRLKRFNISWTEFQNMIDSQLKKCKICDNDLAGKFVIDHDHSCCEGRYSCGKCIRGILCNSCNLGLGNFKDNKKILESAIKYLVD
jgi:hypothetical protein